MAAVDSRFRRAELGFATRNFWRRAKPSKIGTSTTTPARRILATPIVLLPYGFRIGGHFTGADGSSISGSTSRDFDVFFAMTEK